MIPPPDGWSLCLLLGGPRDGQYVEVRDDCLALIVPRPPDFSLLIGHSVVENQRSIMNGEYHRSVRERNVFYWLHKDKELRRD